MPISTVWILKYVQQCYVKWFWTVSSLGAPDGFHNHSTMITIKQQYPRYITPLTQAFHHLTDDVLHDPRLMPQDAKFSQFLEKKVGVMIIWSLKVFRTFVFWFLIIMSFLERPCKQDRFICCCVLMEFIINAMIF